MAENGYSNIPAEVYYMRLEAISTVLFLGVLPCSLLHKMRNSEGSGFSLFQGRKMHGIVLVFLHTLIT